MGNIGFMSKLVNKTDHKLCHSLAKEIFGGDMLDVALPRLDGFERCGESFDTVISANPATYIGSSEALKMPKLRLRILLKLYLIVSNLSVQIEVAMNTKRKTIGRTFNGSQISTDDERAIINQRFTLSSGKQLYST